MFTWDLYFGITNHNKKLNVTSSKKCNYLSGHESLWNHSEKWWRRRRRDEWMREWKEKVKIMGEFWGAKGLPQYVAATIVDSLGDETHQANAPSTINQVDFPFNLQFLYNLSSIIAPINLTILSVLWVFQSFPFWIHQGQSIDGTWKQRLLSSAFSATEAVPSCSLIFLSYWTIEKEPSSYSLKKHREILSKFSLKNSCGSIFINY